MTEEHVPQPKAWEDWTEEDHLKFRMFSSHCPMCRYKYEYGLLQNLVATAEAGDDTTKQAIIPVIHQKQLMLMEIGLFIASSVDDASREAGSRGHN